MESLTLKRVFAGMGFVAVLAGVLVGCGGGGSGIFGGLNIFISDDLSTGYDQIWVTVHEVEIESAGGGHTTVFESADGVLVNLTTLNDGAARFVFLGNNSIDAGDYTGVRVTLAKDLTLVPTGSTNGEAAVFDAAFDNGSGMTEVSFNFASSETFAGVNNLVIDFDLSLWENVGGVVSPVVVEGDDTGVDNETRHEEDDYEGTVSALRGSAPNQTFTLSSGEGHKIRVSTDADTVFFNEDGSHSPKLASGQRVEVSGVFDGLSDTVLARKIKLEDGSDDSDEVEVKGETFDFDEVGRSFDVAIREAEDFLPSDGVVHVTFSQETMFFDRSGAPMSMADMMALLTAGSLDVEVEGTYDDPSNTITATKIKKHHGEGGDHEAEAKGLASEINGDAGTLELTLREWYGFSSGVGTRVTVVTTGSTQFFGPNEESWSAEQFFSEVANGALVKVEGAYENGTITAHELVLKADPDGADDHDEAKGYIASFNEEANTVTLEVNEWSGFDSSFGAHLTVQLDEGTDLLDGEGNELTKSQFYDLLEAGSEMDCKGTFAEGVMNAKRCRLDVVFLS